MIDLTEEGLRKKCPHCDPNSFALKHKLETTENFYVVCDVHPLCQGHILIIPKQHFACIGVYPNELLDEVQKLYVRVKTFIKSIYGSVSTFEHGITGQTVFHSHIQMFPYAGSINAIIPEGHKYIFHIDDIAELGNLFAENQQYLFVSIGESKWVVDPCLGEAGLFRIRFGKALGIEERARWKEMRKDKKLMDDGDLHIKELVNAWEEYHK